MANVLDLAMGIAPIVPSPTAPETSVSGRTSWTARELLETDFPEPPWVVPELLPVGLGILAGRPKIGKSWLALQLSVAVATGGWFLGVQVERAPVLYLALEDSPRRLKSRLELMKVPKEAELRFETSWPPLNGEAGGLGDLQRRLENSEVRLVVIDTLTRAFDSHQDWNDIASVTAFLGALQQEAFKYNVAILCVDHHRKPSVMSRDTVSDVLGSTGKSAVSDVLWGLYRERGQKGFTLSVVGRDVEGADLALEFDKVTHAWQSLGDAEGVRRDTVRGDVVEALKVLGGEATTSEIAEYLETNKGTVARALAELVTSGQVTRGVRRGHTIPYKLAT